MTAQLPQERLVKTIEQLEHFATNLKWTNVSGAQTLLFAADGLRALLAAHEQEPVGTFRKTAIGYAPSYHEDAVPLYTHPAPVPSVPDAASKLLNILDRHTVELGWCEPPISLAELVIARDGREELDTIRTMLSGGKS